MALITSQQIKAARGLLDWGQEALARAAGLGVKTIRALENGARSAQSLGAVRRAFEKEGIGFIGDIGVKRRDDQVRVLRGCAAVDEFVEIVSGAMARQSANEGTRAGAEMLFVGQSLEGLARAFGVTHFAERRLADFLEPFGAMRCVVATPPTAFEQAAFWPGFTCRLTNENEIGPADYAVFGDQAVQIHRESCGAVWFITFDLTAATLEYRRHFLGVWGGAAALAGTNVPRKAAGSGIARAHSVRDIQAPFAAKTQ